MSAAERTEFLPRRRNGLFHAVDQRGHALDANLEAVTRLDRADAAGGAGEDDITREQGQVRRDETDELEAIKNELGGARVLAELTVLEKLDGQFVRVDL